MINIVLMIHGSGNIISTLKWELQVIQYAKLHFAIYCLIFVRRVRLIDGVALLQRLVFEDDENMKILLHG